MQRVIRSSLASAALVVVATSSLSCLSSTSDPAQPSVGQTTSTQKTVGPDGDTVQFAGGTLTVPKGALGAPTNIVLSTIAGEASPSGFTVLSPIVHCEPSGTTFGQPVIMKIPFRDDGKPVTIFWSTAADPSFKDVGGTVAGGVVTANVSHFSSGFVGRAN